MSKPHADTGDVGGDGIGYCIRPGTAVPPTVLVADMGDGALFLQGWRAGPSAYVCAADATPLREALAAAFGSDPLLCADTGTSAVRHPQL
ncbi:MAG: hypothetical protein ACRDRW_05430 [Pseudonocardiaceae bacterium]